MDRPSIYWQNMHTKFFNQFKYDERLYAISVKKVPENIIMLMFFKVNTKLFCSHLCKLFQSDHFLILCLFLARFEEHPTFRHCHQLYFVTWVWYIPQLANKQVLLLRYAYKHRQAQVNWCICIYNLQNQYINILSQLMKKIMTNFIHYISYWILNYFSAPFIQKVVLVSFWRMR